MKKTTLLTLASLIALFSTVFILPAQAATVHDLDLLTAASAGEVVADTQASGSNYIYDHAIGSIDKMTQVIFSYAFTPKDNVHASILMNFTNPNPLLSYEITMGPSPGTAQMILKNLSGAAAAFDTYFLYTKSNLDLVTTYGGAAVANVPLPAALPLFGLGLLGLAGFKRLKGNKNAA
ncbi:MAG TPA: hypothetical protein DCY07_00445 [Rhodospirillaceae bacterium]|nr:hypothetical protein [Rhodospirillaceae bacterium]